jgi:hypothetical protein
MNCPRCSGSARSSGGHDISVLGIENGRLTRTMEKAPKMKCTDCGHVFVQRPLLREALARDHVVSVVRNVGTTEAARRLGCQEKTALSIVKTWTDLREGDVPEFRPVAMAMHPFRAGGEERVLICDTHAGELVDMTVSVPAAGEWIGARVGRVDTVLLPVDAALRAEVETLLPDARILVAPRTAIRSMRAMAGRMLRQLSSEGRRNFRETPALLDLKDDELDEMQADEIGFWSAPAKALRRHLQALTSGIGRSPEAFRKALVPAMDFLATVLPGTALANLLMNWSEAFAAGAGNGWLDEVGTQMENLSKAVFARLPRSGYDVLRAVLVFPQTARSGDGGVSLLALAREVSGVRQGPNMTSVTV